MTDFSLVECWIFLEAYWSIILTISLETFTHQRLFLLFPLFQCHLVKSCYPSYNFIKKGFEQTVLRVHVSLLGEITFSLIEDFKFFFTFIYVCVSMCMYWFICMYIGLCMHMYVHVCEPACRGQIDGACLPQSSSTLVFEMDISCWTWDSPIQLDCLTPGIRLVLPLQCWHHRCALLSLAFSWILGFWTSVLMFT